MNHIRYYPNSEHDSCGAICLRTRSGQPPPGIEKEEAGGLGGRGELARTV